MYFFRYRIMFEIPTISFTYIHLHMTIRFSIQNTLFKYSVLQNITTIAVIIRIDNRENILSGKC